MSAADGQPLGTPAEEARRLVEALGEWAGGRLGAADEHLATGAPECQVCPVCQLISALRGDRPEVLARFGEAWSAFVGVLAGHSHPSAAGTAASDAGPAGSAPGATPAATAATAADPRPPGNPVRPVQNIDVG